MAGQFESGRKTFSQMDIRARCGLTGIEQEFALQGNGIARRVLPSLEGYGSPWRAN